MSTTIDERVVSMQFDNRQFESNVSTSLSTLDKLKQSLNLTGATKGLEDIDAAAKKVDMSSLGNAIHAVGLKFNGLYVMADQYLRGLEMRIEQTAKRMIAAFTTDPIKTGLQEYETQIGAIQTILANTQSKGTTLEDVNGALDELNRYADMTIYNFTEMTRNIGTFTAAGVDLSTSVSAIKGIANLAAVSGSTSQQASTAMYQLSQALASGTIRLMDWNSVVNAGMGGQVFQDALKETARVHGVAIDDIIEKEGSFRESLSTGWLSSEILLETLNKFTGDLTEEQLRSMGYTEQQIAEIMELGKTANNAATKVKTFTQLMDTLKEAAQSGWTQTWELLIGDFEEARELWTSVSDVFGGFINSSAEARNNMLSGALDSSWDKLIKKVNEAGVETEDFEEKVRSVAKSKGYDVEALVEKYGSLEKAFREGAISADVLTDTILANGIKIGKFGDLIDSMTDMSGRELLIESVKNAFQGLMSVLKPVKEAFREVFPPITSEQLYKFLEGLRDLTAKFKLSDSQAAKLKSTFKGLFSILDIGWTFIKEAVSGVIDLLGSFSGLGDGILEVTGSWGNWISGLRDSIKEGNIFGRAFDKIADVLSKVIEKLKPIGAFLRDSFKAPGFEGFLSLMQNIWSFASKIGGKIIEIGGNIGKALGGGFSNGTFASIIDVFNSGVFGAILLKLHGFFGSVKDIPGIFSELSKAIGAFTEGIKANALKNIAIAIGILAISLVILASINPERLASALTALTGCFIDLFGALKVLGKSDIKLKGFGPMIMTMIGMSFAILILATALKKLSSLSWDELGRGLAGVAGLAVIMIASMKLLGNGKGTFMKGALNVVIFAGAIAILSSVAKSLASMSWEELGKAGAGLLGLAIILVASAKVLGNGKGSFAKGAINILIFAGAIAILASVAKTLASMSWEELGKAGAGLLGLAIILVASAKILGKGSSNMISTGIGLVLFAASLKILASAMIDVASLSWEQIAKGLVGLAGAMLSIALTMHLMPKNMIGIGVGLLIVSTSLAILAKVLGKMGGMSWEEIAKGLVALGGSMLILALGLNLMRGTIGGSAALLIAAAALAIMAPVMKLLGSMSWIEIAKGLVVLAGAFAVIGVAGLLLGPLVPAILGLAAAFALIGIGTLAAGVGLMAISVGIGMLATAISGGATIIVAGLATIITGILDMIPTIILGLGDTIKAICVVIAECAPAIGEAIKALVITLVDVLVTCAPKLAEGALKLILALSDALVTYMPQLIESLGNLLISLFDGLSIKLPELLDSLLNLFASIFNGLGDALSKLDISGFASAIGNVFGSLIGGFVSGIVEGLVNSLPDIGTDLSAFMTNLKPFIDGANTLDESSMNAVMKLAAAITLLTGASFMDAITSFISGGSSLSDFATQLVPFGEAITEFSSIVSGKIDEGAVTSAANAGKILAEMASALPNSGGVAGFFAGENNLADFAPQLVSFGSAIVDFSATVSGKIDEGAVTAAANAGLVMAEMASALPNSGGVAGFFAGENNMDDFGTKLVSFGSSIVSFSSTVSGQINEDAITATANLGRMMVEMAGTLPNSGGVVSWFTGDNDLATFGTQLVSFGESMVDFSEKVAGNIDESAVTASINAASALAEMSESLPESGGFLSVFTADNDMSTFAKEIKKLGEGLADFSTEVTDIDESAVRTAANAAKNIASMASEIPSAEGVTNIGTFSDKLRSLGIGIQKFVEDMSAVSSEEISGAVSQVEELMSSLTDLSDIDSSGIKSFGDELSKIGKNGVDKFVTSLKEAGPKVSDAGKSMIKSLVDAISSSENTIIKAFSSSIDNALITIKGYVSQFYSAGMNVVSGFANGITAHTFMAEATAKAMALAALEAAKEALDEHSASRETYKVGAFFGEGFVNAIHDYERTTYKAGFSVAESARRGLGNAISKVRDMLESDIDSQPTIRPVLDLSDVSDGVGAINGMFGMNPSVGVLSNVRTISSMMDNRQNGSNDDVISAIRELGTAITGSSGSTYMIEGITYDDGSSMAEAVKSITRAARLERRI